MVQKEQATAQSERSEKKRRCPNCGADLDGELIFDTFLKKYENEATAEETASYYGATKTHGRWGRETAIYSLDLDKTVAYRCPDCMHEWPASG